MTFALVDHSIVIPVLTQVIHTHFTLPNKIRHLEQFDTEARTNFELPIDASNLIVTAADETEDFHHQE